jgi:hypothetical protein
MANMDNAALLTSQLTHAINERHMEAIVFALDNLLKN